MRVAAATLLVGLALAASGCGSRGASIAAGPPWSPPPSCAAERPGCVGAVVREMTRRLDRLAGACDHGAAFALMYLRVTEAVRRGGETPQAFADRGYLAHLDAVFARLYFGAFDDWRSGRHGDVPEAWRIAFELADRGRVTGIGDLLLGMNAHISRDLPFAVAEIGFGAKRRGAEQASFEQVNGLLANVSEPMLREAAARLDPTIGSFTLPVLATNRSNLGLVLGRWREAALHDADRLLRAPTPARRAAVARSIERNAAARAAVIAAATSRVPFSKAGRGRDAYCRARVGHAS